MCVHALCVCNTMYVCVRACVCICLRVFIILCVCVCVVYTHAFMPAHIIFMHAVYEELQLCCCFLLCMYVHACSWAQGHYSGQLIVEK